MQSNSSKTVTIGGKEYDCDDLAEREREKLKKRRTYQKKYSKKRESTKNVDRIEEATDVVEESIENRIKKGDKVPESEVKGLIKRLENTIKDLRELRKKAS